MLGRIRSRLTYANVASSIALFIALGTGGAYAADTIGSSDIINESILSEDVKNLEVKASDIAGAAVTNSKLGNSSVGSGKIADGGVATADLAAGAVDGSKILDAAVANADLADGSVTSAKVVDDTQVGGGLTATDLATNSVAQSEIATDGVAALEIQDNSIDSGEIVDFQLTNQDIGVLFAQVNANGTIANSSGGVTGSRIALGQYEIDFGRNITACGFYATQGEAGAGGAPGAILGVTDRGGNVEAVFVTVRTNANAAADRAFQLLVVC